MSILGIALAFLLQSRGPGIEGFVVHAGTNPPFGLSNARIELPAPRGDTPVIVRTDGAGRFVLPGLTPGSHRILVTRDGFLRQEGSFRVEGEPQAPLAFALEPAPTIAGVVRDTADAPIAKITVQALRVQYSTLGQKKWSLVASARTDDRGEYRLYWLDPGEYVVNAMPPEVPLVQIAPAGQRGQPPRTAAAVSYAPTFYPGFNDPADAKAIRLESGRDAEGVDIQLAVQPAVAVTGSTFSAVTGRSVPAAVRLFPAVDAPGGASYQANSLPPGAAGSGSFTIPRVFAGSYVATAVGIDADTGEEVSAAVRVRVSNFDPRVALEMTPLQQVRGRVVRASGGAAPGQMTVGLEPVDPAMSPGSSAAVRPNGEFVLDGVRPGVYMLRIDNTPDDTYAEAVFFASANALGAPLTVRYARGESPPGVEVRLADDGGRAAGVVYDPAGVPVPGASVVLAPRDGSRTDLFRAAASDEKGGFLMRGVPPGEYVVLAWQKLEPNAHLNSDYLRAYAGQGVSVSISPGENSVISVPLVESAR